MTATGSTDDDPRPRSLRVRAPMGRQVDVVAVRRGLTLRALEDGSGQLAGMLMAFGLNAATWLFSLTRHGWTIGVVSVDPEPWAGQRVLYREHWEHGDPRDRIAELARQVELGDLPIPQPRGVLFRRKP